MCIYQIKFIITIVYYLYAYLVVKIIDKARVTLCLLSKKVDELSASPKYFIQESICLNSVSMLTVFEN